MDKNENDGDCVNEPQLTYGGANIQFFSSLQEENEATHKLMADRTPEESLQVANMIIMAMYRKELENKEKPYTSITFLNNGLPDKRTIGNDPATD